MKIKKLRQFKTVVMIIAVAALIAVSFSNYSEGSPYFGCIINGKYYYYVFLKGFCTYDVDSGVRILSKEIKPDSRIIEYEGMLYYLYGDRLVCTDINTLKTVTIATLSELTDTSVKNFFLEDPILYNGLIAVRFYELYANAPKYILYNIKENSLELSSEVPNGITAEINGRIESLDFYEKTVLTIRDENVLFTAREKTTGVQALYFSADSMRSFSKICDPQNAVKISFDYPWLCIWDYNGPNAMLYKIENTNGMASAKFYRNIPFIKRGFKKPWE